MSCGNGHVVGISTVSSAIYELGNVAQNVCSISENCLKIWRDDREEALCNMLIDAKIRTVNCPLCSWYENTQIWNSIVISFSSPYLRPKDRRAAFLST